jgi:hypothetical protein
MGVLIINRVEDNITWEELVVLCKTGNLTYSKLLTGCDLEIVYYCGSAMPKCVTVDNYPILRELLPPKDEAEFLVSVYNGDGEDEVHTGINYTLSVIELTLL